MLQSKWFKWARAAVLAASPIVVAKLTEACPVLFTKAGALALAGGLVAGFLALRKSSRGTAMAGVHVWTWSAAGSLWMVFKEQLSAACGNDFLQQVPTILATAIVVGIGSFVHGEAESEARS